MDIFDYNITSFLAEWEPNKNRTSTHEVYIYNKNREYLGKIFSENKDEFSVFNYEGKIVLTAYKRKNFEEYTYDIKDPNDTLVGKASINSKSQKKEMIMRDEQETKVLSLVGPKNLPGIYTIDNTAGKNVAKFVVKIEEIKKLFGLSKKYRNKCLLQINHPSYNRKILMGFFLSIMACFFDKQYDA